jgi:hypothetical protein
MPRVRCPMLTWQDDERFEVGDTTFRAMPGRGEGLKEFRSAAKRAMDAGDLFVAKLRWRIEDYVQLLDRLRPQRIFELGIYLGGSAALFAEIARPAWSRSTADRRCIPRLRNT